MNLVKFIWFINCFFRIGYENNLIKEEETMKKNIHLFVSIFVMSFAEGRAKNRRIAIILLPQE
jgi:hypothetical protein